MYHVITLIVIVILTVIRTVHTNYSYNLEQPVAMATAVHATPYYSLY